MIFLMLYLVNGYLHQYLHKTPALDNQCSNQNNIGLNYLVGEKYFYNYFTQGGAYADLSRLTFILWVKFVDNNPYKSTGRQILFQLVDGSDDNPYVNIQLSVFPSNGQLQLALYSGDVSTSYKPQYQMSLSNVANANRLLGWNQIVISIDQSIATSYLNMKLYDSSKNTNYQLQVPNINGTMYQYLQNISFTYRISQQTRLTNEALLGQYKVDTRACAFIANFHYYIGWVTMDTEAILDYSSQQVFYVQPNGVTLDSSVNSISLKSQSSMFYDSQNKSLHIYKSTRLEYIFKQQMDSFIMSFWINPNIVTKGLINPNYQLFSLTDDSLLNTAIGLGINNQLQLLMYQRFSTKSIAQLDVGWTHIIAYVMQNSWSNDFIPQSFKLMTIYVNGVNVTQFSIDNIFQWTRIVIGFLFRDVQDDNYVQLREIQMYSGMSLSKSKYGCLVLSDSNFILCDPNNPQFTFTASQCPKQTQPTYQSCQIGTTACNITASQGIIKQYSILYQDQYVYNSPTCIKGSAYPCGLSMNKGCADCQSGATRCIPECISVIDGTYNFNDNGICKQVCPYYATYSFDCSLNVTVVQCYNQCPNGYVVVNNGICQHPDFAPILPLRQRKHDPIKGLIYNYNNFTPSSNLRDYATYRNAQLLFPNIYFDPTKTQLQYFVGCQKIPFFLVQQNVTQQCIYPCCLCYFTTKTSCLTCQDPNQFLDRQFSSCVKSCDQSYGILKLNHRLTMTCEQTCPKGFYKQEIECVSSCSPNYYLFNGTCTDTIPSGYYINNNIPTPCPQVCETCTDQLTCQTCVGNYPMNGNMCVTQCPYFLDFTTNTCVFQCQSSDLVYQTANLNGFAFKVCFKNQCGVVQANKLIQTVQHQTNTKQCAQPCDDGYYADYGLVKCIKCKSPCLTCQDTQDFCVTCITNYFFYWNNCFDKCPNMYEDTINSKCVGGCDVGYTLITSTYKACVQYCDNNKYGINAFYYKLQCLITPNTGTYCTGYHCFDCDTSCLTCNGPSNSNCLSCANLYLYNNTCNASCPVNLYAISTTWTCSSTCPVGTFSMDGQLACFNPCPGGTYQYSNKCYQTQQQSTYCNKVQNTYICSDCYLTCQSCTDKASNTCTQCKSGLYFWQGQCLTKCPKGIYQYNYSCYQQCPNGLKMQDDTCVTTCASSYISFSNYCGTSCPEGFFKILIFCIPCYLGCATCTSGDQNQCQSCTFGYYFQQGNTCGQSCPANLPYKNQITNKCDSQCPDTGFIKVQPDANYCVRLCQTKCPNQTWANGNECRVCDKNCTVCFGDLISQCSSCSTGNYLDQSTCVNACPSQRPFANQVDNKCLALCPQYTFLESMYCFQSCPSYLYNYELKPASMECVRSCYPGSYISGQHCLACAPQCLYCYESNQNSCLKCQTGYYLSVTTCQSTCPTYYDEVNQNCVPNCDPSQYILNNKCLGSCPQGYLNYLMQCVQSCPPVTYKNNLECLPCDYSCLVCQDGTNQLCSKCLSNYFMNGSMCTLICPILYDYINYLCVSGGPIGSYQLDKQCVTSCSPTYLTVSDQMSCVQQCPTGYYQDSQQFLQCDPICTACTAIDKCQACAQDYALNIDKCVQICWLNDKLFYDKVNRLCQSICPNFHYAAYGKYICVDKCDLYYSGQFCVDSCQSGYYGDDQNYCTLCPTNCIECTAIDNCTSCQFCPNQRIMLNQLHRLILRCFDSTVC